MKLREFIKATAVTIALSVLLVVKAHAAAIQLTPASTVGGLGGIVPISIQGSNFARPADPINNIPADTGAIGGYISISFDTTILQLSNLTWGTDFDPTFNLLVTDLATVNSTGTLIISSGTFGAGLPTFTMATLDFISVGLGNTFVSIADGYGTCTVCSQQWTYTDLSAIQGIQFTGASVSVVPIPPAIWLLGSGLVGLIGMARRKRNNTVISA